MGPAPPATPHRTVHDTKVRSIWSSHSQCCYAKYSLICHHCTFRYVDIRKRADSKCSSFVLWFPVELELELHRCFSPHTLRFVSQEWLPSSYHNNPGQSYVVQVVELFMCFLLTSLKVVPFIFVFSRLRESMVEKFQREKQTQS